jgi:hypothetical protein
MNYMTCKLSADRTAYSDILHRLGTLKRSLYNRFRLLVLAVPLLECDSYLKVVGQYHGIRQELVKTFLGLFHNLLFIVNGAKHECPELR